MLEGIIIPVAVALLTKLGSKAIDHFWDRASSGNTSIVKKDGSLGITEKHAGRTYIQKDYTATSREPHPAHIVGNLYTPTSIQEVLTGEEAAIVLLTEESNLESYLFITDLQVGYEIYLPAGVYSFYVFLMDMTAEDFFDAEIYAVGFLSQIDLSEISEITVSEHDDIWNLVTSEPIVISHGKEYLLDFILIDTIEIPEFPLHFGDVLMEEEIQFHDLTGVWQLEDESEFGSGIAELDLVQTGASLSGMLLIKHTMDDGRKSLTQEFVAGEIDNDCISLWGTDYRIIYGDIEDYCLDRWDGVIENDCTISGTSEDEAGTLGMFTLTRIQDR